MQTEKTPLEGVIIITPDIFSDERGFFVETFQEKRYQEIFGADVHFVQDNFSASKKGVLRGLHYQASPFAQAKLVQVVKGRVLDVAVDVRFGSPTFGQFVSVELSEENHKQFFIPAGFAHGFVALEDDTLFQYKCTNVYSKEHERGIIWNDKAIGIEWGIKQPLVSGKDNEHPLLQDIVQDFVYQKK
ncbi:MAG: dTDP-4-dehydrorhamnose 3,5-epimerase [Candidatus Moranbacteria bacterium]|nr:dTDP-4-dehydrorhamnose 3,5-epimerase [Candidatus Moranbacteria bacterium]MDD3964796.1 dTDP-4-dehydrorhamnose 3,5-epimerase [Candidatus Moranbacteria bacterium]